MPEKKPTFAEQLRVGQNGEASIAKWLRDVGKWDILPVYDRSDDEHKGPRLYIPGSDMDARPRALSACTAARS